MLFRVTKPENSGLYCLDEVLQIFIGNLFDEVEPFSAQLFPDYFETVLINSSGTRDRFQSLYDEYNLLEEDDKIEFGEIYHNQCDALDGFCDIDYEVIPVPEALEEIWKSCKELTKYLYNTTIGLVCFCQLENVSTTMNEHFEEYREINGNVCCLCGLQEYEDEREIESDNGEVQWRASYDHYLPKKKYPLLSVNFDNLIPSCHTCNEEAKGQLDTLYENNQRILAFAPYYVDRENSLRLDLDEQERKWELEFDIRDADENSKNLNWDRLFKIKTRAKKRVNDFFDQTWLSPLLIDVTTVQEVRDRLTIEIQRLRNRVKNEREAYFKALAFEALLSKNDETIRNYLLASNSMYGDIIEEL